MSPPSEVEAESGVANGHFALATRPNRHLPVFKARRTAHGNSKEHIKLGLLVTLIPRAAIDVRQPIHTRAVARWKNYAGTLAPIQEKLAPYLRAFGYA